MQFKKFVLLALVSYFDLTITQPIKRTPGGIISKPAVIHA
jgi:hypothetical protein